MMERQGLPAAADTLLAALPDGFGLRHTPGDNVVGVAPNELTTSDHRDPIAGTPYHKHVPARLEPLVTAGPVASR
jgi:anaerobic selenocysteine-containing dehydrogenase